MSVAAIAATAVSAGESFLPYMAATCGMLGPLMTLEEEKMLNVRDRNKYINTTINTASAYSRKIIMRTVQVHYLSYYQQE